MHQTIDNNWDQFYKEFPHIYDRFAKTSTSAVSIIHEMFDLKDKIVLDVGSGTGLSTFDLAKRAKFVVGIEPFDSMLRFSVTKSASMNVRNVTFLRGIAETLPFKDSAFDLAVSVYGFPFWFAEAGREGRDLAGKFVLDAAENIKEGGYIVAVNSSPGCYAGELTSIVCPEEAGAEKVDDLMSGHLGFSYKDVIVTSEYGSLQEAIETYGFIFGEKAIVYLTAHDKTAINWKLRIHYKQV